MTAKSKIQDLMTLAKPMKEVQVGKLPRFDMVIVDADSLIYQIGWTTANAERAKRAFDAMIQELMDRANTKTCYVLVKGDTNFRYFCDPFYKVKRREADYTTPEVKARTEALLKYVQKTYGKCEDGGEADDWAAILMKQEILAGKTPLLCHIDKDLNMIPGWHYHIKMKDFYYQTPEQSFYFMMKQLLIGDMSSDSIPGLNKIGEVKAAEKMRGKRLSELKALTIYLWQTNSHGIQQNNPKESYTTNQEKIARMFVSANCLILRDDPELLRPLTRREILDLMTWEEKNDPIIDDQVELIRMGLYSLSPASYIAGEEVRENFINKRERQTEFAKRREREGLPAYEDTETRAKELKAKVRYKTAVLGSRTKSLPTYNPADTLKKRTRGVVSQSAPVPKKGVVAR
jgi:5'-3' exonuclease